LDVNVKLNDIHLISSHQFIYKHVYSYKDCSKASPPRRFAPFISTPAGQCSHWSSDYGPHEPLHIHLYSLHHLDPYTFVTTSTFGMTSIVWNPFNYNIVFTYAKASTDYRMAVSISQLNYVIPASRRLRYQLDVDKNTKSNTGVVMTFYSSSANRINKLATILLTI
jgi:hypothetical protein